MQYPFTSSTQRLNAPSNVKQYCVHTGENLINNQIKRVSLIVLSRARVNQEFQIPDELHPTVESLSSKIL